MQETCLERASKATGIHHSLLPSKALLKKCGSSDCDICKLPRLPAENFSKLFHIPDPVPGTDGHYLSFTEVFGNDTDEKHCPSLQNSAKRKSLPFVASVKHANNTGLLV